MQSGDLFNYFGIYECEEDCLIGSVNMKLVNERTKEVTIIKLDLSKDALETGGVFI